MSLDVFSLNSKRDFNDFIKLPWQIYKGNPYWVPPLISEIKEILDLQKNPFWEHARRELFIARQDGKVVGRIAAIVDDTHNSFHEEKTGFFGFFESVNDQKVANILYDTAKAWLVKGGMTIMRGPASPSLNDECAFLSEGFDLPPTVMMPYSPPYYLELSEKYGLKKAKGMYAMLVKTGTEGIPERIERMVNIVKKRTKVTIRPADFKQFDREIKYLKEIYNAAWEKNWGFVPMTDKEIDLAAKKLKQFAVPGLIQFAEIDGVPVGVTVTVPDINQALIKINGRLDPISILKLLYYKRKIDGARSLIGGVKREYRSTGIIAVLFYETAKAGLKLGYKWSELGWNLEDNDLINEFDIAIGGKIYKKYIMYEMGI
jgi:hypothetical protein